MPSLRRRSNAPLVAAGASAVLLVVLSGLPVGYGPQERASGLHGALGLTFPYQYGTPVVPRSEGAQGVQGLNVPYSFLGPHSLGQVGTQGHLGPVNGTNPLIFTKTVTGLLLRVWNGTVNSSVPAAFVHVSIRNLTYNTYVNGTTTSKGYLNETDYVGWYLLNVTPSTPASWIGSITQIWLGMAPNNVVRYLLPSSLSSVTVGNGPAAHFGNYYVRPDLNFDSDNRTPQVWVELVNISGGHNLATAITGNNGTATFLNVYRGAPANIVYNVSIDGYGNNYTGVKYYDYNFSQNPGSNVQENLTTVPYTRTTGFPTGTPIPFTNYRCCTQFNGGNWDDSGTHPASTITGGTTFFSLVPAVGGRMRFYNALVYINSTYARSGGFYNGSLTFVNSTVIFLQPGNFYQFNDSVFVNNSRILGNYQRFTDNDFPSLKRDGIVNFLQLNAGRSLGSIISTGYTQGPPSGSIRNTLLDNLTTGAGSVTLGFDSVTNYSMLNTGRCPTIFINHTFVFNSTFICALGSQFFFSDVFDYSDFYENNGNVSFVNSYVNLSVTPEASRQGKAFAWGNPGQGLPNPAASTRDFLTSDYISVPVNPTLPILAFKKTTTNPTGGFHNNSFWPWANTTNVSFTIWNMTMDPGYNISLQAGILHGYDDDFEMNYSDAQMLAGGQGFNEVIGGFQIGIGDGLIWSGSWNYSILNWATMLDFSTAGNFYLAHDVFPWTYQVYPFAQTQYFGHKHLANEEIVYTNDTWRYAYWNTTVIKYVHTYQLGGSGNTGVQDLGGGDPQGSPASQATGQGYLNFTHDSFWGRPLGVMGIQVANWILAGQEQILSNVSHTVFYNSPRYTLGQSTFSPTYGEDVETGAQKNSFFDDWFLNLTNQTAPLGSNVGVGGGQSPPYLGAISIVACRFFYEPILYSQTFVPPYGPWLKAQNLTGSPVLTDPILSAGQVFTLQSTLTYEIPEGLGTPTTARGGAYVFNTSNFQTEPTGYLGWNSASTGGVNNFWTVPKVWSFGVEPDVNISPGIPTISYLYGYTGGPQPNLTWLNHAYTLSVEPTYVRVGADNGHAPSVVVQFQGLTPKSKYPVNIYLAPLDSLTLNSSTVLSDKQGRINVTFVPSVNVTQEDVVLGNLSVNQTYAPIISSPTNPTAPPKGISCSATCIVGGGAFLLGAIFVAIPETRKMLWPYVLMTAGGAVATISIAASFF